MDQKLMDSAEIMGMFCRLKMSGKKNLPIRSSEMGVMIYIEKQKEPVTPSMISSFFRIAKPSVTAQVGVLVRKGYLEKRTSEMDQRSYTLTLSDKGRELLESAFTDYYSSVGKLKEEMGSESFQLFVELMKKANEILEAREE